VHSGWLVVRGFFCVLGGLNCCSSEDNNTHKKTKTDLKVWLGGKGCARERKKVAAVLVVCASFCAVWLKKNQKREEKGVHPLFACAGLCAWVVCAKVVKNHQIARKGKRWKPKKCRETENGGTRYNGLKRVPHWTITNHVPYSLCVVEICKCVVVVVREQDEVAKRKKKKKMVLQTRWMQCGRGRSKKCTGKSERQNAHDTREKNHSSSLAHAHKPQTDIQIKTKCSEPQPQNKNQNKKQ